VQIEPLNRQKWLTVVELSTAVADYIENFYNSARRQLRLADTHRIRSPTRTENPGRIL
jgi:hypothetical protein